GGVTTASVTTTVQLPVGINQAITATYSGDANHTSSSGPVIQSVNPDPTVTIVTTSATPTVYGQQVTFNATVNATSPGSGTPTGTVTFMVGSTPLGTVTLSTAGGVTSASYTTSALQLPAGIGQTVTAAYNGDGNYASSSRTVSQTVIKADSTVTVISSASPS